MSLRPDLNGLRVQLPGNPAIYLIDQGRKRHIPDPATYNNLFRDWNGIIQDPHINDIDSGEPLSVGASLVEGFGDPAVYLVDQGTKRHVASPAVMDRYDFAWNKIYKVPPITISAIPTGAVITNP